MFSEPQLAHCLLLVLSLSENLEVEALLPLELLKAALNLDLDTRQRDLAEYRTDSNLEDAVEAAAQGDQPTEYHCSDHTCYRKHL